MLDHMLNQEDNENCHYSIEKEPTYAREHSYEGVSIRMREHLGAERGCHLMAQTEACYPGEDLAKEGFHGGP